jgi:hypothetical protein
MANTVFNKKHLREYAAYGSIAGLLHVFTVWYFLHRSNYQTSAVVFIGSIFFMFVIMMYALRLTKRRPDNNSIWVMIMAGQMTVAVGVIVSVIGSFILCCFYIRGFMNSGDGVDIFQNVPHGFNVNSDSLKLIFITSTIENYGAGAFISAMISYALKPNQTQDQTPAIFEEPAKPGIL